MKIGNKILVEVVIDQKVENSLGTYYVVHVDQFNQSDIGKSYKSSISFEIIEGKNIIR